jgi:hypothetical protein
MRTFTTTKQVDGNTVAVLEKHYSDGSVTEHINGEIKILAIGKGKIGKVFAEIQNQEYLEYQRLSNN